MASRHELYLCEFGCGFCGAYGTVAAHESDCAKGLAVLERGIESLGSSRRGRSRSRSRSPRGVNAAHVHVGDLVVVFHSSDPGKGTWPTIPNNPYRRRYEQMRSLFGFHEHDLPADRTRGRAEQVVDEWGQRGVVLRVPEQNGKCYYVNLDGVQRCSVFDADMGRLEELEQRAETEPDREERERLFAEANSIRVRYELEPLLHRAFHAERQKFNLLQGLEETARADSQFMNAATYWQEQRESAERMCQTLGELSQNAMARGERTGATENFKEAVTVLNDVLSRGEGLVRAYRQAAGRPPSPSDSSTRGLDSGEEDSCSDDISDTAPEGRWATGPTMVYDPHETGALLGSPGDLPDVDI